MEGEQGVVIGKRGEEEDGGGEESACSILGHRERKKMGRKKKRVRDTGIESDDHVPSTEIPTHVK